MIARPQLQTALDRATWLSATPSEPTSEPVNSPASGEPEINYEAVAWAEYGAIAVGIVAVVAIVGVLVLAGIGARTVWGWWF